MLRVVLGETDQLTLPLLDAEVVDDEHTREEVTL